MNISFEIRKAIVTDAPAIHALIGELAAYECATHEFTLTLEQLTIDGFGENPAYTCLVAISNMQVVGIALYYPKYATWKGKCWYLDDLIVTEKYKRKGIGMALMLHLKQLAKAAGVNRLEWQVLDWNKPAINFYKKIGAELDPTWINVKFRKEQL